MYSKDFLADFYKTLYTIRIFEQQGMKLYRKGYIIGYYHPYLGEEAIAVGAGKALGKDDYIAITHRGHGHCIARGGDLKKMFAELIGRKTGYCKGMGGSMHIADLSVGNLGANGIVGGGIPLAVGAALGIKIKKTDNVAVAFFSDGASCNGVFGESLNLATAWSLPMIFFIENNQYAVSTPVEQCAREAELYKRGHGYGTLSFQINGNDVLKVYEQMKEAIEICKSGKGPVLIEAITFRHGGHHVNDPGHYLPKEKLDYYHANNPVDIGKKYLTEMGKATTKEVEAIEKAVEEDIEAAVEYAINSPEMDFNEFLSFVECYNG